MSEKQEPGLGAFSAPVTFRVQVGDAWYEFRSTGLTFTPAGSETKRTLSGTGTFLPVGTPTPMPNPAPTPLVTKLTLTQAPGLTTVNGEVMIDPRGTFHGAVVGLTSDLPGMKLLPSLVVPAGVLKALFTATVPEVSTPTVARVTATLGNSQVTGSVTLQPRPHPAPTPTPRLLNVRDFGVKGDGVANEVTALNTLIRQAAPGSTLFFPAGIYLLPDALKVLRPDLGFLGEGDASILKLTGNSYHVQIGSGQPFTGFSFRKLHFYGTPGKYMQDGTAHGGILNFGSKGTVFEECLFTGCAEPIIGAGSAGSTYGTVVKNCRILGWGRVAIFCNGGERVSGCRLIQDDPNLMGERSSHGFYIHGGCKDVEIADTEIANVRKYALQVYSESEPSSTDNIRLLRLAIRDCANGIITAHGSPQAGRLTNALIEGCIIQGVYAGSSIAIKNGEGVMIRNNVINGNTGAAAGRSGAGIYLGVWAPYEPGFTLKDVQVVGNTVRGCDRGIWCLPSNGGKFTNIKIAGNTVSGNRIDYDIQGDGVTVER